MEDWQIAKEMFGKNTKRECKIVSSIRKHGIVETLCEVWSIVTDIRLKDDCGWLVPNTCLSNKFPTFKTP